MQMKTVSRALLSRLYASGAGFRPATLSALIRDGNNNYSISCPSLMPISFPYATLRRANGAP